MINLLKKPRLRDKVWVWGHAPGSHDHYKIPCSSRMTAAEGALYMNVPNLIVVRYGKEPKMPYDQLAASFRSLKNVVWGMVSAGGSTNLEEREHVLTLPDKFPNVKGFIFDDFWSSENVDAVPRLSLEEMTSIYSNAKERNCDLWAVLYNADLHNKQRLMPYMDLFDHITLWFWEPESLNNLEFYIEDARQFAPEKKIYLGCYLWDYGRMQPVERKWVVKQLDYAGKAILKGEIEGLVLLASCIFDTGIESVEIARKWLEREGDRMTWKPL